MLHEDALLELCIEIFAAVASIHGNEHSVQLLLRVLLGLEDVVWDRSLVIEECHLLLFIIIPVSLFPQLTTHSNM